MRPIGVPFSPFRVGNVNPFLVLGDEPVGAFRRLHKRLDAPISARCARPVSLRDRRWLVHRSFGFRAASSPCRSDFAIPILERSDLPRPLPCLSDEPGNRSYSSDAGPTLCPPLETDEVSVERSLIPRSTSRASCGERRGRNLASGISGSPGRKDPVAGAPGCALRVRVLGRERDRSLAARDRSFFPSVSESSTRRFGQKARASGARKHEPVIMSSRRPSRLQSAERLSGSVFPYQRNHSTSNFGAGAADDLCGGV